MFESDMHLMGLKKARLSKSSNCDPNCSVTCPIGLHEKLDKTSCASEKKLGLLWSASTSTATILTGILHGIITQMNNTLRRLQMNGESWHLFKVLASKPTWFGKILKHCIVLPQKPFFTTRKYESIYCFY